MKFKMTMVAVVVALAATNLYAQETYNVEVVGATGSKNTDDQTKQTLTMFNGIYYFKPIKIETNQPYAELDFLQKASSISLTYGNQSIETANVVNTTITPLGITGTVYIDNLILGFNSSNWSADLKLKSNTARYTGIKANTTGVDIGYFVTPETALSFTTSKDTASYTPSAGVAAQVDLNITTNSITSRTVTSLGGSQSMRVDLQYNQITREQTLSLKNNEYGFSLRYYPDSKYYVEGGYLTNTGDRDYDKGKTLSAGAGILFTPRFGVLLSTAKFTGDVSTEQSSSTLTILTAGYRF
jgi:hypothetical protein